MHAFDRSFPVTLNLYSHFNFPIYTVKRILLAIFLAAELLIVAPVQLGRAANILFVKASANSDGNCLSWENACSLQQALMQAVTGDEIWVAAGTYTPTNNIDRTATFHLKSGVAIYGGFDGSESLRGQRDWTIKSTTLSGEIGAATDTSDNTYHVVTSSSVDSTALLDGFTISGGNAGDLSSPQNLGGGLYNDHGSPNLVNVIFSNNSARTKGGGIYTDGGNLHLLNVIFSGNTSYSGGGMYSTTSSIDLENVNFNNNSAVDGGGMFLDSGNGGLLNIVFRGNTATSIGGGLYARGGGSMCLFNGIFIGNSAKSLGGGMYTDTYPVTLTNAIFSGNTAGQGGGMYIYSGGVSLSNLTITANSALTGAAIFFHYANVRLNNSILWGNKASDQRQLGGSGMNLPDINYTIFEGGWSLGAGNLSFDPLFVRAPSPGADGKWGSTGSSGGYDDDYGDLHPRSGSMAMETGNNNALTSDILDMDNDGDVSETVPYDLDGHARLANFLGGTDLRVDRGAYEGINTAPTIESILDQVINEDTTLTITLKVGDEHTIPGDLTVDAISENLLLIPNTNLALSGSGAERKVTLTPANDLYGTSVITVTSSDGLLDTTHKFTLTVRPVNDAPSFAPGENITVTEDSGAYGSATGVLWARAISAGPPNESDQSLNFQVINSSPSLFVVPPTLDSAGFLNFTPATNANGTAYISVVIHDSGGIQYGGVDTSSTQIFTITITPVNDAPILNVISDQYVAEGSLLSFNAIASDIDQPAQELIYSLDPSAPSDAQINSTNGLFTWIPSEAQGPATYTVTVIVADNGSPVLKSLQMFHIQVDEINQPPLARNDSYTLLENHSLTVNAPGLLFNDVDPDLPINPLNVLPLDTPTTSTLVIHSDGSFLYIPTLDWNGSETFDYVLSDNYLTSTAQVTITVIPVNNAPSFTLGGDVTVLEDSGTYDHAWATGISAGPLDENWQSVSFTVTNTHPDLFTIQPTLDSAGHLRFTLAPDSNGQAQISVRLKDNGGILYGGEDTSVIQTCSIIVIPVNDPPTFVPGPNVVVIDTPIPYQTIWANDLSAGPANEQTQKLMFTVLSNSNSSLFSVQPDLDSTGRLSFTPVRGANGEATLTIQLADDGGNTNGGDPGSAIFSFTITVIQYLFQLHLPIVIR